jgi:hypothetical protein
VFLPLVSGGAAPDLIFDPAELALAPGQTASVSVRVEPAADLRGASFELPGVQEGVSSSFAAAADGKTGTLTVEASTALVAGERALMVQGTSGDGKRGWVGSLKVKTKPAAGATTYFVDPVKGNDANKGTQDKPFKTLAKALSKAKKGDTIRLGKGVYSKNTSGELFSPGGLQGLVPAGVTIVGTLDGGQRVSILKGPATGGLNLAGDATVKDLDIRGFGQAIFANKGKQTLSNLFLSENAASLVVEVSAQTTLIGSTIIVRSAGVQVGRQGQFIMDGGSIEGASPGCEIGGTGIELRGSGQATLKNGALLVNLLGPALSMQETSKAPLSGATISRINFTCPGTVGILSRSFGNAALSNANLTLKNTDVSGYSKAGIALTGNEKLVIDGGTIRLNGIGINITADSTHVPPSRSVGRR